MAKGERKPRHADTASQPGSAVADEEYPVSDLTGEAGDRDELRRESTSARPQQAVPAEPGRGFFEIYKPGQGYHTRVGSAMGGGALLCWFAYFVWDKLSVLETSPTTKIIQAAVPVAILAVFGVLGYWLLALNRRICDFLIATEGEMKKVNWTSRKDILGSTKVVIAVMLFLCVLLFVVDVGFMLFFNSIGVLKGGGGVLDIVRGFFK